MIKILYRKIIIGAVGMLFGSVGMVNVYATEVEIPIVQVSNLKYSYEQMQQDLDALEERYPGQMQVNSLGTTADGRDITRGSSWGCKCGASYSYSGDHACQRIYKYSFGNESD